MGTRRDSERHINIQYSSNSIQSSLHTPKQCIHPSSVYTQELYTPRDCRSETPSYKIMANIMCTNSGVSGLDRLPIEILRHIAAIGTCEAALALSKVNKTLRTACHDRLVFKAIIDNRNGNEGPAWRHHLPLSMETPVSSWARYALADSKAAQDHASGPETAKLVSWAPQLMVYHRKVFSVQQTILSSVSSPSQIPFSISPVPWSWTRPSNSLEPRQQTLHMP